jgi:hypothetical protein
MGQSYAAERWARAVLKLVLADEDPRTISQWARLTGASRGTLGTWCRSASVSPRNSLELGRLLRAVRVTNGSLEDLHNVLNVVEPRTVKRMLARSGLGQLIEDDGHVADPGGVLARQVLVTNGKALGALKRALDEAW